MATSTLKLIGLLRAFIFQSAGLPAWSKHGTSSELDTTFDVVLIPCDALQHADGWSTSGRSQGQTIRRMNNVASVHLQTNLQTTFSRYGDSCVNRGPLMTVQDVRKLSSALQDCTRSLHRGNLCQDDLICQHEQLQANLVTEQSVGRGRVGQAEVAVCRG